MLCSWVHVAVSCLGTSSDQLALPCSMQVSLELAADNKDFTSTTARSAAAAQQVPAHAVRSPRLEFHEPNRNGVNAESCVKFSNHEDLQKTGAASTNVGWPPQAASTSGACNLMAQTPASEDYGLLLHVLLMVPDGKDFIAEQDGLHTSCNVYLNCKLLSTEEATRSAVIWGTTQPAFNFSQASHLSSMLHWFKSAIPPWHLFQRWFYVCRNLCSALSNTLKVFSALFWLLCMVWNAAPWITQIINETQSTKEKQLEKFRLKLGTKFDVSFLCLEKKALRMAS